MRRSPKRGCHRETAESHPKKTEGSAENLGAPRCKRPSGSRKPPGSSDSPAETPKQRQLVTDQPLPHSRWPRNARGRTRKARGNPAPNGTAAFRSEGWPISRQTLKKGANVQVEGELRSREYEKDGVKHRVFECRLESVLKLDRAERRGADESDAN